MTETLDNKSAARDAGRFDTVADLLCMDGAPVRYAGNTCPRCGKARSLHTAGRAAWHTPGPWKALGYSDGQDRRKLIVVAGTGDGGRPVIGIADGNLQGEANARLVAAAPELLAALFGLVFCKLGARTSPQGHDQWKIWADQYRDDPKVDVGLLAAVDSIGKAEGT